MEKRLGYVVDVDYPAHFHKEMQPVWLEALLGFLGTAAPNIDQPYRYCELGCGTGIGLLVAAASNPLGQFVGVDFNARHIAIAQAAAASIGLSNVRFIEADFSTFFRENHSAFDFVVSHGVWSWVAPNLQQEMVRWLKNSLKPQGVFYLHYMCHPGATAMIPVQKLVLQLARHSQGSSTERLDQALGVLSTLLDTGSLAHQPALEASARYLLDKEAAYLAHDFLSEHWCVQHSVDVHQQVAQAQVSYIGSANSFNNLERLSIPGVIQPLLMDTAAPAVREVLKDLVRMPHQRQDLFQRQARRLSVAEHLQQAGRLVFALLKDAPRSGAQVFQTAMGDIAAPEAVLSPLLERLAQGPASFDELRSLPVFEKDLVALSQSLQLLMNQGWVHPVRRSPLASLEPVQGLARWLEQQSIALQLLPECGTACHRAVLGA